MWSLEMIRFLNSLPNPTTRITEEHMPAVRKTLARIRKQKQTKAKRKGRVNGRT